MRTLIIRLPNHLGDACMTLPTLDRLAGQGITLTLVGRPWAAELFAAYPWQVIALPVARSARIAALHALRLGEQRPCNALLLTNSFSSALEFRLAGLRPAGYATDGRSLLLRPAIAVPPGWSGDMHTVEYYLHLAQTLLNLAPGPASAPQLRLTDAARERAAAALARAGIGAKYVALCPVAQGRHRGRIKCWSGFGRMGRELIGGGYEVVVCPGPGEQAAAKAAIPEARMIEPLDLGAFGALLAGSRLVIANDSGPGHLAAAVGARLVGVFGVTDPAKTRPRSLRARLVGGSGGWPSYDLVAAVVAAELAEG
ncbi:Heptosyltransferase II [Burkholderiales bacterium]|nr:Heptosyltransferase II [Burkholderiales bacterium]